MRSIHNHEQPTRKAQTGEMQESFVTNINVLCGPDKLDRHHVHNGWLKLGSSMTQTQAV